MEERVPIGWADEKGRERASAAPGIVIVLLARVNAAYKSTPRWIERTRRSPHFATPPFPCNPLSADRFC